jgi:O-antigen/teichoic acid export membrane protein
MASVKKIATNAFMITLSQIVNYGLGFIFLAYTARYLKSDSYGLLITGVTITQFFTIFADFGLHMLMTREISRNKGNASRYFNNIAVMKCGLLLVILAAIVLLAHAVGYPGEERTVIYFMALSMVFFSFSGLFFALFQAFDNMKYQAIGLVLTNVIMILGAAIVTGCHLGVVYFSAIYLAANALVFLYAFSVCTLQFFRPSFLFDAGFWKKLAGEAAPFGISSLFITVYTIFGTMALSIIQGYNAVGLYSAAYRLISYLIIVPGIFNVAMFPTMSNLSVSSGESLKFLCHKYQKMMILAGLPLAFSFTALADKIIVFIYGSNFTGSAQVLQILIWSIVFTYAAAPLVLLCQAINKQIVITRITALVMVANVALNLLLIPVFGYLGTGIITVANELIVICLVYVSTYKLGYSLSAKKMLGILFKVVASCLVMLAFIFIFHGIHVVVLLPLAYLVYAIMIFLLRCVDDTDLSLAKSILKRGPTYV